MTTLCGAPITMLKTKPSQRHPTCERHVRTAGERCFAHRSAPVPAPAVRHE